MVRANTLVGLVIALVALAGCADTETTSVTPSTSTIEIETIETIEIETETETIEPVTSEVAVVVTEPDLAGVMPDVLCMDLQEAQDLIQTRGVFYSRSEDATGEGRMQLIDSNWIVVAQEPAAGEPIDEGDATLSVLKDAEVSECTPGVGGS